MEANMALVTDTPEAPEKARPSRIWRETTITKDIIFHGKDEYGRSGWFVRLTVSGLYVRRVGPFPKKQAALDVLEEFLGEVMTEALLEVENGVLDDSTYVVEGFPKLQGR